MRTVDTKSLRDAASARSIEDLRTGSLRQLPIQLKMVALAQLKNRWGTKAAVSGTSAVTGRSTNGVTYTMGREQPSLPPARSGTPAVDRSSDDFVVCKTTPMDAVRAFAGPINLPGLPSTQNQSVIYPGALFRDADVVKGIFTPLSLTRKGGNLDIDVFNPGGAVTASVSSFANRSAIMTAINTLRSGAQNAQALTAFEYTEFELKAGLQMNIEAEVSMEANIAEAIGIPVPVTAGAGGGLSQGFEEGINFAVAAVNQIYYTISLGGDGPASTVDGTVPDNAVCVSDVAYGRRAFIIVGSYTSRAEAKAVAHELVNVTEQGGAEANLSIQARRALEAGFVRVTVLGGSVDKAVLVKDLSTMRDYIEKIDPTVGGVNAVPIAYNLRYAKDNAPALVGAFASLEDHECFRATQLKVTLHSIKPTKVVDFGDEELYGRVSVEEIGNKASGSRWLWNRERSNWVAGRSGQNINGGSGDVVINLNSAVHSENSVDVTIDIKDRVMDDPEAFGASNTAKENGYVSYTKKTITVPFSDISAAPNGVLSRTVTVTEGDAAIEVRLSFQLTRP